jgi:hypothetical protein
MGGLLLIGLLIELWELITRIWPVLLIAFLVYLFGRWVLLPAWDERAQEMRDQLRHEQARREIDRITLEASQAMCDAALRSGDFIEGTAVEIKRR